MRVGTNCVVSINFKLTNDQGELLDASEEGTPLVYLHGGAGIVPGLETELEGKEAGEHFSVAIPPEEGFGEHKPEMVQQIPLNAFPDVDQIKPGAGFQAKNNDTGQTIDLRITAVTDEHATADGNHPLAGVTLHFDGTVQDVREATEEEVSQGCPL